MITLKDTEQSLCSELENFQFQNALPYDCALEQLNSENLTTAQREWLTDFNLRWEALFN